MPAANHTLLPSPVTASSATTPAPENAVACLHATLAVMRADDGPSFCQLCALPLLSSCFLTASLSSARPPAYRRQALTISLSCAAKGGRSLHQRKPRLITRGPRAFVHFNNSPSARRRGVRRLGGLRPCAHTPLPYLRLALLRKSHRKTPGAIPARYGAHGPAHLRELETQHPCVSNFCSKKRESTDTRRRPQCPHMPTIACNGDGSSKPSASTSG